jgi:antitoxin (DNA-binding transcriptional repressor) of toxin-antitoxin stability system
LKFLKCKPDPFSFLNEGNEIVVMKRKKPIARLTIIQENTPEALLLDIGRALNESGVTKEEAFRALERARREIYG